MKKILYILCIALFSLSILGCSEKKKELRQACYEIEKVYPTRNLEELIEKFPNGYIVQQHYEFEDFSYSLELRKEGDAPLQGIMESDKEYEVIYEDSTFKCEQELLFKKFLFQEIELNEEVLSKQKEKIDYNWIEGVGGSFIYEMNDPRINQILHKNIDETFRLIVSNYQYTIIIEYDDGIWYRESVESI